jgi:pantoate--beta-alanine ligase
MQVVRYKERIREIARRERGTGKTLALVPTMGALHDGHLGLVEAANRLADHVTVSIFVNPTQFVEGEDLDRYPRDLDADVARLKKHAVDAVFAPSVEEMYPKGDSTIVHVEGADQHLCGRFRPGHFQGVTTIVSRLFVITEPDLAFFGLKDAQQFLIIRKMVRDLGMGTEIVGVPTVREDDGLALSSRNVYLSPDERSQATVLSEAVFAARKLIESGEREVQKVKAAMRGRIESASLARLQYAEVVDTDTIAPVESIAPGQELLAATAVFFSETRLIDNQFVKAP